VENARLNTGMWSKSCSLHCRSLEYGQSVAIPEIMTAGYTIFHLFLIFKIVSFSMRFFMIMFCMFSHLWIIKQPNHRLSGFHFFSK